MQTMCRLAGKDLVSFDFRFGCAVTGECMHAGGLPMQLEGGAQRATLFDPYAVIGNSADD